MAAEVKVKRKKRDAVPPRTDAGFEESQVRLKAVFDDALIGIAISDMQGKAIQVNQCLQDMLGYSEAELRNLQFMQVSHPDDIERHQVFVSEIMQGKRDKFTLEKRYIRKNGEIMWGRLNASLVKDPKGKPLFVISMLEDITASKLREEDLRQTREVLQRLVDVSPVVIFSADPYPPHSARYISRNVEAILGYTDEEYYTDSSFWIEHIHPDERQSALLANLHLTSAGRVDFEYRFLHADGTYHWIHESSVLTRDEQAQPLEILGSFMDITRSRMDRQVLEESEERYRTLADAAHDLIYVVAKDDTVLYVNRYALQALGKSIEDVIGKPRSALFIDEDAESQAASLKKVFEMGVSHYYESHTSFRYGKIWLGTQLVPLRNQEGEFYAVLGISRDITERKLVEDDLQKAVEREKELSELKSRFVTKTSHEFRTPLSTILSSAELLEHYGHRWPENKRLEHLHRIEDTVKGMTTMLDDIIQLGRINAGKLENAPVLLDLVEVCEDMVEEMQLGDHDQHPIQFSKNQEAVQAYLDVKLLHQIFTNLLSNAMKYSPAGSPIVFSLATDDHLAVCKVTDRGIGIPADEVNILFEPFHRAINAAEYPGNGLGLAITREAVLTLGGEISVESTLGEGTTFQVVFPLWSPEGS